MSIQIGNVAPVRPSFVFYPESPRSELDALRQFGLMAPAALRAIGSVEAAKVTLRPRVHIDLDRSSGSTDQGDQILRLTYGYSLTGVDLGLQHASGLTVAIQGSCVTEYGWLVDDLTGSDLKMYRPWGIPGQEVFIPHDSPSIARSPEASFLPHPDARRQYAERGNVSFAIVVGSARRASVTAGSDPWYTTEERPDSLPSAPYNATFWMKVQRPVLSCWQRDEWSYKAQVAGPFFAVRTILGLNLPRRCSRSLRALLLRLQLYARQCLRRRGAPVRDHEPQRHDQCGGLQHSKRYGTLGFSQFCGLAEHLHRRRHVWLHR